MANTGERLGEAGACWGGGPLSRGFREEVLAWAETLFLEEQNWHIGQGESHGGAKVHAGGSKPVDGPEWRHRGP